MKCSAGAFVLSGGRVNGRSYRKFWKYSCVCCFAGWPPRFREEPSDPPASAAIVAAGSAGRTTRSGDNGCGVLFFPGDETVLKLPVRVRVRSLGDTSGAAASVPRGGEYVDMVAVTKWPGEDGVTPAVRLSGRPWESTTGAGCGGADDLRLEIALPCSTPVDILLNYVVVLEVYVSSNV